MPYTKRDYQAFATLLKISAQTYYDHRKYHELEGVHEATARCADLFAMHDPHFDRNKFLKAAKENENWNYPDTGEVRNFINQRVRK